MKKMILLFMCIIFSLGMWCQQENTLVTEGKRWAVWSMSGPEEYVTFNFILKEDTLIGGKLYKKLWSTTYEDFSKLMLEEYCMREESGKIYFYRYKDKKEYVWFDFNLKAGNTYIFENELGTYTVPVVAVRDTVFENSGDGIRRKCIYTEGMGCMVDGIGSLSYGIEEVFPLTTGVYDRALLCSHDKNIRTYQNDRFDTCFRSVTGSSIPINSVVEKLKVQCTEQGELFFQWEAPLSFMTLRIYDESGALHYQKAIRADEYHLSVNLLQGTYFYVLNSLKGSDVSGKIYVK